MTRAEKDYWIYAIVRKFQEEYDFDVDSGAIQNYFTLREDALYFLDCLAALIGIKPDQYGRSRSRVLWNRVQRGRNQLPF